jgi:hypothetical protein
MEAGSCHPELVEGFFFQLPASLFSLPKNLKRLREGEVCFDKSCNSNQLKIWN